MIDTVPAFVLLTMAAALGFLATITRIRSDADAARLARAFLIVSITLGLSALALSTLAAFGMLQLAGALGILFRVLVFRAWIVIGGALAAGALVVLARTGPPRWQRTLTHGPVHSYLTSPQVPLALAASTALAYVAVEIGKLAHDAEMRQFFTQSGLPVWANYVVMLLEFSGALALLWPLTRAAAAAGLSAILLGAIATHAHNGDPFSDSLEAVHLLVTLVCLLIVLAGIPSRTLHRAAPEPISASDQVPAPTDRSPADTSVAW